MDDNQMSGFISESVQRGLNHCVSFTMVMTAGDDKIPEEVKQDVLAAAQFLTRLESVTPVGCLCVENYLGADDD
jgi:hypothetical protein